MLVLHIGSPKTGTTAIQNYLFKGQERLESAGCRYLRSGRKSIAHNPLARVFAGRHPADDLPALQSEISESDARVKILSSEMFFLPGIAASIGNTLRGLGEEIKVVVYIRRPDAYAEAMYKQRVKNGRIAPDPMAYLTRFGEQLRFRPILTEFENAFGKDAICVRPFDRARLDGGNVVQDFWAQLGMGPFSDDDALTGETNKSLSRAVSEQIGQVAQHTPFNVRVMIRQLIADASPDTRRSNDVYDLATRRNIVEASKADLDWLSDRFLGGQGPAFQFDDLAADAEDKYPDCKEMLRLERAAIRKVIPLVGRQMAERQGNADGE